MLDQLNFKKELSRKLSSRSPTESAKLAEMLEQDSLRSLRTESKKTREENHESVNTM